MNLSQTETTVLRRVRLRAGGNDSLNAQLRLGRILAGANLIPASLPASAIVLVRRLRDPLPRVLKLDDKTSAAPTPWTRALVAAMSDIVAKAARPALGPVRADAPAVLFMDRSELLACLATDWSRGLVTARWWWHDLQAAGADLRGLVLRMWLEQPEYIPAAMEHLAQSGSVVDVARSFSHDESWTIVRVVSASFALDRIRAAISELLPVLGSEAQECLMEPAFEHTGFHHASARVEPWLQYAPESCSPELRFEQQCAVGISLALRRAPATVQSKQFLDVVSAWVRRIVHERTHVRRIEQPEVEESSAAAHHMQELPSKAGDAVTASPLFGSLPILEGGEAGRDSQIDHAAPVRSPLRSLLAPSPSVAGAAVRQTQSATRTLKRTAASEFETCLGGSFYLINVGIALKLYGDFTTPAEPGIPLSIWKFIRLTAARLFVNKHPADGLWAFLDALCGPCDEEQLEKPAHEWIDELVPQMRLYLDQVLRKHLLCQEENDDDGALVALIEHDARIVSTPAHLDMFFSLQSLPLAIRIAGLDRNPGWVPAAGRFIAYHYEG